MILFIFGEVALVAFAKLQAHRVEAVALSRLGRAVVKYMAEVRAAVAADDLGPLHTVALVGQQLHRALQSFIKGWPAGTRVELRARREECCAACGAAVHTVALLVEKRS